MPLTWPLQWETMPETVLAEPGAATPRPAVSRCGRPRRGGGGGPTRPVNHQHGLISIKVSDIEPPDEGQKTTKYLQMHAKMCHFYCAEGHETWVFRTWIGVLSHCARIFRLRWAVCSQIERKRPNRAGCKQPALARDGDKVDFVCASGGEGPVLHSLSALGLNASPSTNRAMHDFVTKLALLSKMWGSVSYTICPLSFVPPLS